MDGSWSKDAGESRGMPSECIGMCTKCQGNAWECMDWVQNARVMQGNERKYPRNVWEWVQSANRMQGNAGKCQGTVREWV